MYKNIFSSDKFDYSTPQLYFLYKTHCSSENKLKNWIKLKNSIQILLIKRSCHSYPCQSVHKDCES